MISICVITYNQEEYIIQTLKGIENQKIDVPFEVLISNDKSTDNSDEIIKNYINQSSIKDNIVYYYQSENLRPLQNLKFLFDKSKYKYIALCEGDDYWTDPLKLQQQFDFIENNPDYSCVFHDAIIVDENNNFISNFNKFKPKNPISKKDTITKGGNLAVTASMFFKNYMDYPNFLFKAKSGDRALRLFLMTKGKFHFINKQMCAYRKHNNGVTQGGNVAVRVQFVKSNIDLLNNFNEYSSYQYNKTITSEISNQYKYLSIFDKGLKVKWNHFLKLNFKDKIKRLGRLFVYFN